MLKQRLAICSVALFLTVICAPVFSEEPSAPVKVKMAELPGAVQKTIHAQLGKGTINSIEKSSDEGEITYDVEMRKGGRARSFTVDEDGTLLDMEVFIGETPPAVREAVKKTAGGVEIEGITKILDEGKVSYGVEITAGDKTRTFTLDENGMLLELQVFSTEAPAPVIQTIRKELGDGKAGDMFKVIEEGETTYEVEITAGEKSRTVIIDPQGEVVSREEKIALRDIPDAAQTAVKTLVKDGKLGVITKSIEDGDTTYDVEIKRGGKWETTSLNADGKVVE